MRKYDPNTPVKLAVYQDMKHGDYMVFQCSGDDDNRFCDYVRVSVPVDTTFPAMRREDFLTNALTVLKEQEQEVRAKLQVELDKLDDIRRNLLCLPAPAAPADDVPF